ncbi:DNA polymerase III subunit alpha [Mycoplasma sp. 'Moose RK']|uniref:DNA polymerase III subunit alpha n=1 Tax=Mycoplasma sp. 'Moose RK' TaxID=2780095 RepID=UPI0018C2CECD|nr:DNA polymerase III subunit alpha [Mycoplasma sp. 'Moose RK']MBG0731077.1 DNA polymerase III subunit alpha [Mycoplasma sp. 'Moose RK']
MKIINLHTTSEYTFLSSTIKLDSLIEFAVKNDLKTLVLTDLNSMYGIPKFYKLCLKNKINPIIGLEIEIENFHFILLAKNYQGYIFLSEISSKKLHNVSLNIVVLENQPDIIIIDHPKKGYFAKTKQQLTNLLQNLKNYFISLNDPTVENAVYVQERDVLFAKEGIYHQYLAKIKGVNFDSKRKFYDFDKWECEIDPIVAERTNLLVENIKIEFPKTQFNLPDLNEESALNPNEFLKKILNKAVAEKQTELQNYIWKKRLAHEYKTICSLNFSNYFLVIWDFLRWARQKKILIGPGRGSASGSLIAYLLDITTVNPLKYDLIFERFLNPERITMPDIDIDIQDTRRGEIIEYLFKKYGNNHCATIITFSTLAARSVFRDISKAFGIPETQINQNAKLIKANFTLQQAYDEKSDFYKLIQKGYNNDSEIYKKIFEISVFLEGVPRQSSTHAAGIVLSKLPIRQLVPTHVSKENLNQLQYSAEFLEDFSLLKIDLLGLKNLTIVDNILQKMSKTGLDLTFLQLPVYSEEANKLLSDGKTSGIFQLESPGMTAAIRLIKVNSIADVSAIISLYRPGPIKQIKVYAANKKSGKWDKFFPEYDKILDSTFGVIIYQEQIMQICQVVAGFSLAQADLIRVAISKKNEEKLAQIRDNFIEKGHKLGHKLATVQKIYDLIYEFADYGFNKAHAIAYATLAYKMAFLKAKFPGFFFVELISNENGAQANIIKYVAEARSFGFKIERPNINFSEENAVFLAETNSIFLPLLMIKGLGIAAVKLIVSERQNHGKYQNFRDFITRMKLINFSKAAFLKLILANALNDFGNQETLLHNFDFLWDNASLVLTDKNGNPVAPVLKENLGLELEKMPFDYEINLENERKLLGMTFFKNPAFEGQTPLTELKKDLEHRVILQVKNVFLKTTKFGKTCHVILADDGNEIEIWTKKIEFSKLEKGKFYHFHLVRKEGKEDKFYFTQPNFKEWGK